MLTAEHLHKRYGPTVALEDFSVTVGPGRIYCLLGPNGAGKTTTIRLFLGLDRPDRGQLHIDGVDVAQDAPAARRRLAYIPELVALYDTLTGRENVEYYSALGGLVLTPPQMRACFARAGLHPDAIDRRVRTYSKGMRQKVGIALALAKEAKLLVLDEPLSGLDPAAANDFCGLLRNLASQGTTVFMVTHDLFRACSLADELGILIAGRLAARCSPRTQSSTEIEAVYLQSIGLSS